MEKKISIIVGGSGQFGITLSKQLLKKNHIVVVTTRNIAKANKKINIKHKNLKIVKLNILKLDQINKIIKKYCPKFIFYFASQSSPNLSFKKKNETHLSNYNGCKNFLEKIKINKLNCKFVNASSSEIFSNTNKKLNINSNKKPISPYGNSKLLAYKLTKYYRTKYKMKTYNAIIFNTESYYRDKNYLIPKICIAAIRAYKFNEQTAFGNINIAREWNWCEEQVKYLIKFLSKEPKDFLLSNQKLFSAKEMLRYAFEYFGLNYQNFISLKNKFLRPKDFIIRRSNSSLIFKKNNINFAYKVYGKRIIYKLIRYYINEKKY